MLHHEFELEQTPLDAFKPAFGRRLTRFYKKGGGSAPSPDPNIGLAALENAKLGKDWLAFAKDQFEVGNKRQEEIDKLNSQIGNSMLDNMNLSNTIAKDQWDDYLANGRPIENQMREDAMGYDSEENQAKAAAEAGSAVVNDFAISRDQNNRAMARMGVNPNSGKFQAVNAQSSNAEALARAGAETNARTATRDKAIALRAGAANFGRNMPNTSMNAMGQSNASGAGAMNSALDANGAWQGNNAIMGQGFQGAMAGNSSMAGILNQQYQNQMQGWLGQQQAGASAAGGIGNMVGMIGSAWLCHSQFKEGITRMDDGALDALLSLEVKRWRYKPEIPLDHDEHVSPMAEDWHEKTGMGDGMTFNPLDAVGVLIKAVQELSAQVAELKKQVEG